MFEQDEFEGWIKASHAMFETLEGRQDAYPVTVFWIQQWFDSKNFRVLEEQYTRISTLIENFDYEIYGVNEKLQREIEGQLKGLLHDSLSIGEHSNVGFALSPFIATWNFWRYKQYFEQGNFNLKQHFEELGEYFGSIKTELDYFRNKRLLNETIDKEKVSDLFNKVNSKLQQIGVGYNEPIGTVKLMHVFAPFCFPLIDNDIGKAFKLLKWIGYRYESLSFEHYLRWINSLKGWLSNYLDVSEKVERDLRYSILKLVDEGFYVMCSVNLKYRLGLRL